MTRNKVLEAPIVHSKAVHCCGCWVFWTDEKDFYAECNECGERISVIDLLDEKTYKPKEGIMNNDMHGNSALVTEKELQERTAAPRVHQSDVDAAVLRSEYTLLPDGRTTICLITMRNGFTIRGESSCVFVENYRKDIGERVAREDAYGKVWAFLGFALAEKRHVEANIAPHTIGWAIKNMWLGGRMTREGWNGKGQYIAIQRPDANSMNTLPYVYIVTVQGQRVPWLASQTDLLATDWQTAF